MTATDDQNRAPDLFDSISDEVDPSDPELTEEDWSVSQLNEAVRELLEGALPPLWIRGEVAGWTRARSGHRYFTLKDDTAELRCVMWRGDAQRLPADPEEGMEIRAFGAATLYEARGTYQFIVRRMDAGGEEGLWRLAFERLRRRLELEGLFRSERKRALPRHPAAVGVVTSATGAAFHDILSVIRRRAPWTRVLLRSCRVQGEGAAEEIAAAVDLLGASGLVDVLIVGRGGGSIEDLWAFNEEAVARAIERCPIPVISAVGHEVDVTISDLVADLRAPTPSAAAEAAVGDATAVAESIGESRRRMSRALIQAATTNRDRIERSMRDMGRAVRARILTLTGIRLRRADEGLRRAPLKGIERVRHRLDRAAGTLDALSPLSAFRRGYVAAQGQDGSILRHPREFPEGLEFTLRLLDGAVECVSRGPIMEAGDGEG